jgi:hypothetical protein
VIPQLHGGEIQTQQNQLQKKKPEYFHNDPTAQRVFWLVKPVTTPVMNSGTFAKVKERKKPALA